MSLPSLFSGQPPDREAFISRHAVEFSPQQWLNRLPETWMFDFLAGYEAPDGRKWPRISRQTIIDTAPQINTPREAVQFYVLACAWDVGVNQRFVTRRTWVLTRNEDVGQRLLAGIQLAQQSSAVGGYGAFRNGGARLKHLGPGFFSKILYFGSWEDSPAQRPLILDQYVAAALNDVADLGWPRTWNWTTAQYEQYLDIAARWASEWGCQPDVIERTLFEHGKTLK